MEYMVRFAQSHETFRLAEIEALAVLEGIKLEVLSYSLTVSTPSTHYPLMLTTSQVAILHSQTAIRRSRHQASKEKYFGQIRLRGVGHRLYL